MPEELVAEKTAVTAQQMALALHEAYHRYFNSHPNRDSIRILLSQWALETGWGKSMWCFNVGNAKSRNGDGHDWCFFKCNEVIKRSTAEALQRASPATAKIASYRSDGLCVIWFHPKHAWARFRAFRTLEDGVRDHLRLIVQKFDKAWPCIVKGDPVEYSRALKRQGYYTADEAQYTRVLKSVFDKLDSIVLPEAPLFTEEERREALNRVALSLQNMGGMPHERHGHRMNGLDTGSRPK